MAIAFRIRDLAAFSLIPENERSFKCGDVYVDSGVLCAATTLNDSPIVVRLSDGPTPIVLEHRFNLSQRALVLDPSLRLVARPIGESVLIESNNIAGWLLPGPGPSVGCLFAKDPYDEPDRIAFDMRNGSGALGVYFHDRRFQFGWPTWEIDWVNEHGEPVLTMARTA